jgi:hypothetical protein
MQFVDVDQVGFGCLTVVLVAKTQSREAQKVCRHEQLGPTGASWRAREVQIHLLD